MKAIFNNGSVPVQTFGVELDEYWHPGGSRGPVPFVGTEKLATFPTRFCASDYAGSSHSSPQPTAVGVSRERLHRGRFLGKHGEMPTLPLDSIASCGVHRIPEYRWIGKWAEQVDDGASAVNIRRLFEASSRQSRRLPHTVDKRGQNIGNY
ncbi:Highly reducing polyketide synthase N1 [Pyricularia oryzae]|uniref:Highly reducing polyketide synthase N1 n=1 Tax=Pyricularia grisea TaxID=148305 RepID=A0ABQ8NXQ9_PYRGI|nr:Highly reducing polyketide synthase N1 [Pyricularia oryzae]KAI6303616.1 Highly reducing polyketide synthase N1 [Pyricularia grisea]KAI6277593.1 Highly reducing polyketide synthase N1 [Pyricularia oryzae]KAI6277647.1 Highly reducing polyketide synthase N1 [Pyricularia oryzae]KAI6313239.1 Highly reducing polyketide synthase N1 [Pyricularia oryzae]